MTGEKASSPRMCCLTYPLCQARRRMGTWLRWRQVHLDSTHSHSKPNELEHQAPSEAGKYERELCSSRRCLCCIPARHQRAVHHCLQQVRGDARQHGKADACTQNRTQLV